MTTLAYNLLRVFIMDAAQLKRSQRIVFSLALAFFVTFSVNNSQASPSVVTPALPEAQLVNGKRIDCDSLLINLIPIRGVSLRNLGKATFALRDGRTEYANVWKDKNLWALIGIDEPGGTRLSDRIFARAPNKDDSRILHISLHGSPSAVGIVNSLSGGSPVETATILKALVDKGMQLDNRELIVLYTCFGAVCNVGTASAAQQLADLTGIRTIAPNGTLAASSYNVDYRQTLGGMFKVSKRANDGLPFWSIVNPKKFRSDSALRSQLPNDLECSIFEN